MRRPVSSALDAVVRSRRRVHCDAWPWRTALLAQQKGGVRADCSSTPADRRLEARRAALDGRRTRGWPGLCAARRHGRCGSGADRAGPARIHAGEPGGDLPQHRPALCDAQDRARRSSDAAAGPQDVARGHELRTPGCEPFHRPVHGAQPHRRYLGAEGRRGCAGALWHGQYAGLAMDFDVGRQVGHLDPGGRGAEGRRDRQPGRSGDPLCAGAEGQRL